MSMPPFHGYTVGDGGYRRVMIALFFAGFAIFAQLYAPQAVLPGLAPALGVSPTRAAESVSAATIGVACAVIAWSVLSDRIGRVPAMAIGILVASALGLAVPFSADLGMLLVLRFCQGAALASIPAIALVYVSEEIAPRSAARAAGSFVAGNSLGGLSGRLLAGGVSDVGSWQWGLGAVGVVCALSAIAFVLVVPRSRGFSPGRERGNRPVGLLSRLGANLRSRTQLTLYAQGLLLMGAFIAVFNYVGFFLGADPFALPLWLTSSVFLIYLVGTVVSPRAGALASRRGRLPVLLGAIALMAAGIGLTSIPHLASVVAGLALFTAGSFAAQVVASGWVPAIARPDARAQASSLYYLAYYLGASVFGWMLGGVFVRAGWPWLVAAVVAMCAAAGVTALVALRGAEDGTRSR